MWQPKLKSVIENIVLLCRKSKYKSWNSCDQTFVNLRGLVVLLTVFLFHSRIQDYYLFIQSRLMVCTAFQIFWKFFQLRWRKPKYGIRLNAEKKNKLKKKQLIDFFPNCQLSMFSLCHHYHYCCIIIIILSAFLLVSSDIRILSMGIVKDAHWDSAAKNYWAPHASAPHASVDYF